MSDRRRWQDRRDETAFLALCAERGIDPNSIPDAEPKRKSRPPGRRGRPRTPQSYKRRRQLGGGGVPPWMKPIYTEAQRAVLFIISGEIKRYNCCTSSNDEIAARAGVSRSVVKTSLHEARRLGHLRVTVRWQLGRKNLTNFIEVIDPTWRKWISPKTTAN